MGIISYQLGRVYRGFTGGVLVLPSRAVALLFCLVLLLLPATGLLDSHYTGVLTVASIFAIYAASWDLLSGFTGQINLGHALFFGVAVYASALLNINVGLHPGLTIPLGALGAALAGLVVGVACLRLRGTYLAFATLAFSLIAVGIIQALPGTGGTLGVTGEKAVEFLSGSATVRYYVAVVVMIVLVFAMWKVTDSKTGIIFHAIREDELTARASGINTTRYKLLAFGLSGFFAGIAGGLYTHHLLIAGPSAMALIISFYAVIFAVFGGIATIYGPVAGAFILWLLMDYLKSAAEEYRMLSVALIIVMIMLFMPEGVTTWVRDKVEKICPRCKLRNVATRKTCRVCAAELD